MPGLTQALTREGELGCGHTLAMLVAGYTAVTATIQDTHVGQQEPTVLQDQVSGPHPADIPVVMEPVEVRVLPSWTGSSTGEHHKASLHRMHIPWLHCEEWRLCRG